MRRPGRLADRPESRGRLKRRAYPIIAYVGPNGGGKSLGMVHDTLPSLDYGRPVLSTVRLLDYRNPRPCDDPSCTYPGHPDHAAAHPLYVPFTDYRQLLEWRDGDVLMDEVTGVASSREVASMPVQVANFLVQLRRRNVVLRWSAPAWKRADLIIREVTQAVVVCTASMGKRRPTPPGEAPRLWSDKRLMLWRMFDSALMDDFETGAADHIEPLARQWVWRPGLLAEAAYDTLDPVTSLGWANDAGMCMSCGGKRTHPRCSCGTDHSRAATNSEASGNPDGRGPRRPKVPGRPSAPYSPGLTVLPSSRVS